MKLNVSRLLICLIPLCFGCTEGASHNTDAIVEGTECNADAAQCIRNSDGSQSLMTCTNGSWKATPCPEDKPVCDEHKNACVSQPQDTETCDLQACNVPEHATAKCNQNACDFECDEGYRKNGDSCVDNQTDSPYCGDSQCNHDETCESCPADCGICGTTPVCGDTYCDSKETCESCPADCGTCGTAPVCGDTYCDSKETCESCPEDCGTCETKVQCGDNKCDSTETCESCPEDCGTCETKVQCGDNKCHSSETCESCPEDCGTCETKVQCGDNKCDSSESCESCPEDCGTCKPTVQCGDNKCDSTETYASCKTDCASKHPCATGCPNKIAFLYSGKYCSEGCATSGTYGTYSTTDIDNFGITHFVICPNGLYDTYGSGNSSNQYPEIIQAMKTTLMTIIDSTNGKNKRVWISTPPFVHYTAIMSAGSLSAKQAIFTKHTPIFKKYIQDLREALGPDIWNTYVLGIYMNSEQVFSKDIFQTIDYDSPYSHAHVKMFKDIADEVHKSVTSGGKTWNAKEFVWSPYYPTDYETAEKIKTIGIVVNRTDIFDDVFIQPTHYFHPGFVANLDAIKQGTYKQAATWLRDGDNECKIVGNTKTSKTRVGVQMEVDSNYYSDASAKTRYNEYVSYFTNKTSVITGYNKNNYKFSYYLGARGYKFEDLQKLVREFHEVEPF